MMIEIDRRAPTEDPWIVELAAETIECVLEVRGCRHRRPHASEAPLLVCGLGRFQDIGWMSSGPYRSCALLPIS